MPRRRLLYLLYVVAVIVLGLCTRRYPHVLPAALGKYPGDALYALMMFFGWGMVLARASTRRIAFIALATSFAVEFSQIYHAPWIDAVRSNPLGHLILGSGFSPKDLGAYIVGVVVGVGFERAIGRPWA